MNIGVLKEVKEREGRVALTPGQVAVLTKDGHRVVVEKNAGLIAGFTDAHYRASGAKIMARSADLIPPCDLILKVKEPALHEVAAMRRGQMIFCYLHLAPVPKLLKAILRQKIIALGYETVRLPDGSLPLLMPMSEIAGKLATQNGAHFLRADQGGRGILLSGATGGTPAYVVILGGGVVGENAARIALGMGARTTLLDISREKLKVLAKRLGKSCELLLSTPAVIAHLVPQADLVVGAVLVPGACAPVLVKSALVKKMKKGSVIVDVAVDQGGCIETSTVTSHTHPVVCKFGVLHYGVPNMPAAVPVTATEALTRATFPYVRALAVLGLEETVKKYPEFKGSINCANGRIIHPGLSGII